MQTHLFISCFLVLSLFAQAQAKGLEQGIEQLEKGSTYEAWISFFCVIEAGEREVEARIWRCFCHVERGDIHAAIDDLHAALAKSEPEALAHYASISRRYIEWRFDESDGLEVELSEAIVKQPRQIQGYLDRADVCRWLGDDLRKSDVGLLDLEIAGILTPGDKSLFREREGDWSLRASSSDDLRDYGRQADDLKKLLSENNPDPDTLEDYAFALWCADRTEEAMIQLDRLFKTGPPQPSWYSKRASCFQTLKRYEEALADENAALKLHLQDPEHEKDPYFQSIYYDRGQLLFKLKRYDEAVESLTLAINYIDDLIKGDVYILRAKTYMKLGKMDLAEEDFTIAIKRYDHFLLKGFLCRAEFYIETQKLDRAIVDAKNAISLAPKVVDGYLLLAKALELAGKDDEAAIQRRYASAVAEILNE